MSERERAIGKRLVELRRALGWSQAKFAKQCGLTLDQLASVEYGRTPLRYTLAYLISKHFGFSCIWLATGNGLFMQHTPMPAPQEINFPETALFSEVFDSFLVRFFKPLEGRAASSEMLHGLHIRVALAEALDEQIEEWLLEIPDHKVFEFEQALSDAADKIGEGIGSDRWDLIAERLQRREQYWQMRARSPIGERKHNSFAAVFANSGLTQVHASVKHEAVKAQWPILKKRLQAATAEKGGKTKLANFLGEKLASVSQWLTDSENAREPGAETTLRMLQWVELQERE